MHKLKKKQQQHANPPITQQETRKTHADLISVATSPIQQLLDFLSFLDGKKTTKAIQI